MASLAQAFADGDGTLGAFGVDDAIMIALSLSSIFGGDKKANYKQYAAASQKVVATLGPDFITGSQALELDYQHTAHDLSNFLKVKGINLTPEQLITDAMAKAPAAKTGSNFNVYLLGGGAVLVLLLLSRRSK